MIATEETNREGRETHEGRNINEGLNKGIQLLVKGNNKELNNRNKGSAMNEIVKS